MDPGETRHNPKLRAHEFFSRRVWPAPYGRQHSQSTRTLHVEHPYYDVSGSVLVTVHRLVASTTGVVIRGPRHSDVNPDDIPIYRHPEVRDGEPPIVIVDGEHSADVLWTLGVTATCSLGGLGRWREHHSSQLRGQDVVIWHDTESSSKHAGDMANSLERSVKSIRVVRSPDHVPEGGHLIGAYTAHGEVFVKHLIANAVPYEGSRSEFGRSDHRSDVGHRVPQPHYRQ